MPAPLRPSAALEALFRRTSARTALQHRQDQAVEVARTGERIDVVNAHRLVERFHTRLPRVRNEPPDFTFKEVDGQVHVTAQLAFDGDSDVFYWRLSQDAPGMDNALAEGSETGGHLTIWALFPSTVSDDQIQDWIRDAKTFVEDTLTRMDHTVEKANGELLVAVQEVLRQRNAAAQRVAELERLHQQG